jgi:uncharacterized protein with LGFP repeats
MTRLKRRPGRTAGRLLLGVTVSALAAALAVPTALASPESDAADAIGQAWEAAGGSGSMVGSQDGDVYQVGSGFGQKFTGGAIFFTPDTGAHLMSGAILDKYQSLGGPADSDLGFPNIDEVPGLIGPDSRVSTFNASDSPAIFWTPDTGAWAVRGALNAAWDKLGGSAGTLGVPTEDERYDGDTVSQRFTGGELSWNSTTKAFTTVPAELADSLAGLEVPTDATTLINLTWRATGGLSGPLGGRQGEQSPIGDNGAAQGYAGGKIFFTPDTGAHAVTGAILSKYESMGGPTGDLGLPASAEGDGGVPNSRVSAFSAPDGPVIFWTPDSGAIVVRGAINAAWAKLGGAAGTLGVPEGEQSVKGDVVTQKFSGGEVSWNRATKEFSTKPGELAAELAGLELPDGVAQAPAGAGSAGADGGSGLGWWWLAIVIPALLLLGLLAGWARRRSSSTDSGSGYTGAGEFSSDRWRGSGQDWAAPAGEFDSDEDAIDTAPTRIPTEAELDEFGASAAVAQTDWRTGDSDVGRHSAGGGESSAWQLDLGDFGAPRRRHAADDADTWTGYGESSFEEQIGEEVEFDVAVEPEPSYDSGDEPWRPAIHLPLADPYQPPEGYFIKANTHSGLYYTPESVLYDNTVPEVWFASEEVAQANGFVRAPE